jgi:hypothetical protein
VDAATEHLREEQSRTAPARRDVEDARVRAEPEALAEEQDLLPRGRVLELVRRLGDDVVAGDHGGIII